MANTRTSLWTTWLALILAAVACNDPNPPAETTPDTTPGTTAPAQPTVETAPPDEVDNRQLGSAAALLPASLRLLVVTSRPASLAERLELADPSPDDDMIDRVPGLGDLHPKRLTAYGLNPLRPAGVFLRGDPSIASRQWGVFAHITDADQLTSVLRARERPLFESDAKNLKRYLVGEDKQLLILEDLAVLAPRTVPLGTTKTLVADERFHELVGALTSGDLAAAYIDSDPPVAVGLSVDGQELVARAVSTKAVRAEAAVREWSQHLYDLDLRAGEAGFLVNRLFHEPTLEQLSKNRRLRNAHEGLAEVKAQIDELESAPAKRRQAAVDKAFAPLDVKRESTQVGAIFIHTRLFTLPPDFSSSLLNNLDSLGPTSDEITALQKLDKRRLTLNRAAAEASEGLDSKVWGKPMKPTEDQIHKLGRFIEDP